MSDFYPISPIIGIINTSYGAQAGVMDEKWAVRVLRGKKIIAEKTIHELDLDSFVGVVYGHIRVEGLSRHSIAQCAGRMMQYAGLPVQCRGLPASLPHAGFRKNYILQRSPRRCHRTGLGRRNRLQKSGSDLSKRIDSSRSLQSYPE